MQFTASAMILTPLTYVWMNNLESTFPAYTGEDPQPKKTDEKRDDETCQTFNVRNTIAKVVLDQTVGAALNTTMFLLTMGILRGQDSGAVMNSIRKVGLFLFTFLELPFVCVLPSLHLDWLFRLAFRSRRKSVAFQWERSRLSDWLSPNFRISGPSCLRV
jgi:hypothetical protein